MILYHTKLFICFVGPPKVHSEKIQYGVEGKIAEIECLAYSVPAPIRMNWTIHNVVRETVGYLKTVLSPKKQNVSNISYCLQPLDLSRKRLEIVEETLADGIRQVLVIHNVKDEDFTSYNCSVTNEYGMDTMQIQLHKQSKTGYILHIFPPHLHRLVCPFASTCSRFLRIELSSRFPHPSEFSSPHVAMA